MSANNARRGPMLAGLPMSYVALITLTFQNSGLILVMHYSRIMPLVNGERAIISTAVLLNEIIKLLISLVVAIYETATKERSQEPSPGVAVELWRGVFSGDSWKLAIPAMLYTLQNSLQYVAVSNLDAATYQVLSQLKILTTAIFSVILLGRSLSSRKWLALVILMLGVGVIQLDPASVEKLWPFSSREKRDIGRLVLRDDHFGIHAREETTHFNSTVGLIAVAIGCMLSGLAGVYFEKVLKDPKSSSDKKASLWIRNIQLSFYSLFPALIIGVIIKDGAEIRVKGFFSGYNWVTWLAIMFQATGGILVALVVKYADNIAKNFATSFSIIVSFLASVYFFDFTITWVYLVGTVLVIAATFLYNITPAPKVAPQPVSDGDLEEQKESEGYSAEKPLLSSTDSSIQPELKVQAPRPQEMDNSQSKRED
ncbi:hypothetical protein AMS68_004929 [Peltaster fructicola]|uniref:Nucleotide-sugar transporter n=1 Tax=Peltaster fructicola TaxID=286661 RepID=A0A6H0XXB3_9PEZI|nr:hypothetical protein AMS68_004929 [Peltaster fructicola]